MSLMDTFVCNIFWSEAGVCFANVVEIEIREHGVIEFGNKLRFASAFDVLKADECSLKDGLEVRSAAIRGIFS